MVGRRAGIAWVGGFALSLGLAGCATLVNGTRQTVEIRGPEPGSTVQVDDGVPRPLPAQIKLNPRRSHILTLRNPLTGDSSELRLVRRVSPWIWANASMGAYGLGGVGLDFITHGAYRLRARPNTWGEVEGGFEYDLDVDPRRIGTWHASAAYTLGFKTYFETEVGDDAIGPDIGLRFTYAKNGWPVDLSLDLYLFSSAMAIDRAVIADVGIRRFITRGAHRFRPFAAGGITLLSESTQEDGGVPAGLWARVGAEFRIGPRGIISPSLGFSKYEPVTMGRNTAGLNFCVSVGTLF